MTRAGGLFAAGTHTILARLTAEAGVALADALVGAFSPMRARLRTRRNFATCPGPRGRTEADSVLADALAVTIVLIHARTIRARGTEMMLVAFADLAALFRRLLARTVAGALIDARVRRAVVALETLETLTLSVDAQSLTAALVRTRLDLARLSGPSRFAIARTVVALALFRAVVRARFRRAIVAGESVVANALELMRADAVSAAGFLGATGAGLRLAIVSHEAGQTFARAVVLASSVVRTRVRTRANLTAGARETGTAKAVSVHAFALAGAFVRADLRRAVLPSPALVARAVLVGVVAFAVSGAFVGANLDFARRARASFVAFAHALVDALAVIAAHVGTGMIFTALADAIQWTKTGTVRLALAAGAVVRTRLGTAVRSDEHLSLERGDVGVDRFALASVVLAFAVFAVAIVRAVAIGTVHSGEAKVAYAVASLRASSVEAAFVRARRYVARDAGESLGTFAVTGLLALSVVAAIVRTLTSVARGAGPHLSLEGGFVFGDFVTRAFAALRVALSVQHVSNAAVFAAISVVAFAFPALVAAAVVPARVRAGSQLTRVPVPSGVALTLTFDAATFTVAIVRASLLAAVRTGESREAFHGAVLDLSTVFDDEEILASVALETAIAFAISIDATSVPGASLWARANVASFSLPSLFAMAHALVARSVIVTIGDGRIQTAEDFLAALAAVSDAGRVVALADAVRARTATAAVVLASTSVAGIADPFVVASTFTAGFAGPVSSATLISRGPSFGFRTFEVSAVGTPITFFAGTSSVVAFSVSRAIVRTNLRIARFTVPRIQTDADVLVAVAAARSSFRASAIAGTFELLARVSPGKVRKLIRTRAGSVLTRSVWRFTKFWARFSGAVVALVSGVAFAFVRSGTDSVIGAVSGASGNGTVHSSPGFGVTSAGSVGLTFTVSVANFSGLV